MFIAAQIVHPNLRRAVVGHGSADTCHVFQLLGIDSQNPKPIRTRFIGKGSTFRPQRFDPARRPSDTGANIQITSDLYSGFAELFQMVRIRSVLKGVGSIGGTGTNDKIYFFDLPPLQGPRLRLITELIH